MLLTTPDSLMPILPMPSLATKKGSEIETCFSCHGMTFNAPSTEGVFFHFEDKSIHTAASLLDLGYFFKM